MRLIFATNNMHKFKEIKEILGEKYKDFIFSLNDLNIKVNPEETGRDFKENSMIKSNAVFNEMDIKGLLKNDDYIIADDTGLCIDYLDGAPGLYSARFMGENVNQEIKNDKILELLKDVKDKERTAYFITVLSVIPFIDGKKCDSLVFEGRVDGYIVKNIEKNGGFGYDPIFAIGNPSDMAKGQVKSYASLGVSGKNKVSHRAQALAKFLNYLEKNHNI